MSDQSRKNVLQMCVRKFENYKAQLENGFNIDNINAFKVLQTLEVLEQGCVINPYEANFSLLSVFPGNKNNVALPTEGSYNKIRNFLDNYDYIVFVLGYLDKECQDVSFTEDWLLNHPARVAKNRKINLITFGFLLHLVFDKRWFKNEGFSIRNYMKGMRKLLIDDVSNQKILDMNDESDDDDNYTGGLRLVS